jgi:hypothetical protein
MRSKRALSSRLLICSSEALLICALRYWHTREIDPFLRRSENTLNRLQQAGQVSLVHSHRPLSDAIFRNQPEVAHRWRNRFLPSVISP